MRKFIFLFISVCFFAGILSAQEKRYTKGAENGYAWLSFQETALPYSTLKQKYLSNILEKNKLIKTKFPGSEDLLCENEVNRLLNTNKSKDFSLDDVIMEIDKFYSYKNNLVIPIIFSYCYVIKKKAGSTKEELKKYLDDVLKFCLE